MTAFFNRKMVVIGIILAFIFWFLMFATFLDITSNIHYNHFWLMMSIATTTLTILSLYAEKQNIKSMFEFKWKYITFGIIHAILLYGLSRLGIYIFENFFEWTVPQIQAIYQTRSQASPIIISLLLLFLIAPAEEIFWRGFIHKRLIDKYGVKIATVIAIFLYTFVHIWAFNVMLLIAAFVLGLHWTLIYAKYRSVIPGIISHAIWDLLIFVILPVQF